MNGGMSLPCVLVKMARKCVAKQPEGKREDYKNFGSGMMKLKKQSNQRRTE